MLPVRSTRSVRWPSLALLLLAPCAVACAHRDAPDGAPAPAPSSSTLVLDNPSAHLRPRLTPSQMQVFENALDKATDAGLRD